MANKPTLEARILYSVPVDPARRLRFYALRSLVGCGIWFLLIGGLLATLQITPFMQWTVGWLCVLLSAFAALGYRTWSPLANRAITFYVLCGLLPLPVFVLILVGGVRLLDALLPSEQALWVYAGFIVGGLALPSAIARRREWIRTSMNEGYLRKSFMREQRAWNPMFDLEHIHKDPQAMRPGVVWRLAFWIGPAIGMSLADMFGRFTALVIGGVILIAASYASITSGTTLAVARVLELLSLEREVGTQIHVVS